MVIILDVLLPVFLVVGIAALAQSRLKLDIASLSRASFYIFSPALVFDALVTSQVSGAEFGQIAATLLLTSLVLWALGEALACVFGLDGPTRAAFLLTIILTNAGNYGLSVNYFAFGEPGLARASLYVTVNSLLWSSLGVYLSARGNSVLHGGVLRRIFSAPVIYAAAVGLLVNLSGWTVPEPLLKALHLLGLAMVPTSLVVLGGQMTETFRERGEASHAPALATISVARLVIAPIIAYFIGSWIGLQPLSHDVVVLESATPTAVMALVLATEFKSNVSFTTLAIMVTTLASLLTVTLWLNWLI